ncbi:conserved protein of unknown function [Tenacibaculum insulae]
METSKERVRNPFIGTYFLSFLIINWKPILFLLFSDLKIEEKFQVIENKYTSLSYNLLLPLAIALIYTIVLPYFMWLIEELNKKSVNGRKNNQTEQLFVDIKNKQNLAIEESKLEDIKANYREKADLNSKIEKFKEINLEYQEIIKTQKIELTKIKEENFNLKGFLNNGLSKEAEEKLTKEFVEFRKSKLFPYFKDIGISINNYSSFPQSLNEIIKEKYIHNEIIQKRESEENNEYYFTEKGKYYWKEYVLGAEVDNYDTYPEQKPELEDLPF